uniref:hypothetical chloroplast RF19 n=1 Tax=Silene alexandrae TaxID=2764675 RepID=UPI0027A3E751|nr:hypothetical chloroplast RF19 [Silene alexandrae]WFF48140.1 hypothetical chloroplast RF19 [Silene alexandrae]
MIFKVFILDKVISLCTKIFNSVVMIGLYYGFLTTFSTGPSYLFLLRAQIMEEGEEGIEKKVAATTGFIMGQLIMFISIYYTPLHLALNRPHTITVLVLPYLLFHFFWNNHKSFLDFEFESTSRNSRRNLSIRNLSIQCVFLNNLIFQLFNHFLLPNSILARLVNIYMFRCNNKMLFLMSSFVAWVIGQALFMKAIGLVLVCIQQNHKIRSKIVRYNKHLISKFLLMEWVEELLLIRWAEVVIRWVGVVLFWIRQTIRSKYIRYNIRSKIFRYIRDNKHLVEELLSMRWVQVVLFWIQENHSRKSTKYIRYKSNKYLVEEFLYFMSRTFSILLLITCLYYLGRMPSPIFTKKLIAEEETNESEDEEGFTEEDPSPSLFSEEKEDPDKIDETEKIRLNGKGKTKDQFHLHLKEAYSKKSPTSYFGNENISTKEILKVFVERPLRSFLFDYKRWNRPTRYIKNNRFENAVRDQTSQYFFDTCQNDGKKKISFTYPPSLSIFWEMIKRKISLSTTEILLDDELYNYWIYTNEQKKNSLSNEFANRIAVLSKGLFYIDGLDKKTQLCNEKTKEKYLPKINDPLLNGPYRAIIKKGFSPSIINETAAQNWIDGILINKIHNILRNDYDYNYHEFEQKKDTFKKKSISKEIRHKMPLMSPFSGESTFNRKGIYLPLEEKQIGSEDQEKFLNFLVDAIIGLNRNKKFFISEEISKQVPCWSHKLIDEIEQEEKREVTLNGIVLDHEIRTRTGTDYLVFSTKFVNNYDDPPSSVELEPEEIALLNLHSKFNESEQEKEEYYLTEYPAESDFDRDLIKGSMRAQRRKTVICRLFQPHAHSPLFLDRLDNYLLFILSIYKDIYRFFKDIKNYIEKKRESIIEKEIKKKREFKTEEEIKKKRELKIEEEIEKKKIRKRKRLDRKKEKEQEIQMDSFQLWDTLDNGILIRGLLLLTQSILRKNIILPGLIIAKNIVRLLLFQRPEWSEDFEELKKEIHIRCTNVGFELSETDFPKNWFEEGIQIKIVFPFRLKPWRKSTQRPSYKKKMKTYKKKMKTYKKKMKTYKKKMKKQKEIDNFSFLTVIGLEAAVPAGMPKKLPPFFKPIFKELKKKITKFSKNQGLKFLKEKSEFLLNVQKEIFIKIKSLLLIRLRDESIEIKKEKSSAINNNIVHESSIQDGFMNQTSYSDSVSEQKKKDLANRIRTIKTKIEKFAKEKNQIFKTLKLISQSYGTKNFESPKNIGQILKKKNTRLIRKSNILQKFFRERLFIDLFLYIINIPRINIEFCLESTKNFIEKRLDNNEKIQERVKVKKKNKEPIQFIKPLLRFVSEINKNSKIISNFSFLSQAYVFYKLSQAEVMNLYLYNLKPIFQYRGTFLFLKNEIKEIFETQVITSSKLKPKKLPNSGRTQWKNWLKLKRNYQYDLSQLKWSQLGPKKWRNRVTEYCEVENKNLQKNKRNSDKKDQLLNAKNIKNYENYLLKNFFLKSENYFLLKQKYNLKKIEKYNILAYNFLFYENKKDSYNYDEPLQVKKKHESFYTFRNRFIDMWWSIPITNYLTNYLEIKCIPDIEKNKKRKYIDIEAWINISSRSNKKTKTETKNYTIVDKVESNQEFLLFPKFLLLYNAYKMKPWVIPINSLLSISQRDSGPDLQETFNGIVKGGHIEDEEFDFALHKYLLYQFKEYDDNEFLEEKFLDLIRLYRFLIKLPKPRGFVLDSVKRNKLNLNALTRTLTLTLGQLKKGMLLRFEPFHLSVKDNGKFIFYQTIGISLIHKSKRQKNQKGNIDSIDKKNPDEWIPIPETCLSPRRRRKWRILMCLNSSNNNGMYRNKNANYNRKKNTIIKYKAFLWPNYRLEDLACMNRYWFDTNNGSRFSLLRIRMYPRLK